jgi:sensor domain CHASE-containing protein
MKKNIFLFDLITSAPFKILIIIILLILLGIMISNRNQRKVRMKEDVIYIHPKQKK